MDETDYSTMPYSLYANNLVVFRTTDISWHMLLGLGIMLSANEVPRIAQQFGLDSSVEINMTSVIHATTTAVTTRGVAKAVK